MNSYQECLCCGKPKDVFVEVDGGGRFTCQEDCDENNDIALYHDEICDLIDQFSAHTDGKNTVRKSAILNTKTIEISDGDTGHTYESLFGNYLMGCKEVIIIEPYITHCFQMNNLSEFFRLCIKCNGIHNISLKTSKSKEHKGHLDESALENILEGWKNKLKSDYCTGFEYELIDDLHDRKIKTDTGWLIHLGRGLHFFKKQNNEKFGLEGQDYFFKECFETTITIVPVGNNT